MACLLKLGRCAWNLFATLGIILTCMATWFLLSDWIDTLHPRVVESQPVSPTARKFAELITRPLITVARDAEPEFVDHASGPVGRWATRKAYPYVLDRIPEATEVCVSHVLTQFGSVNMRDVADLIVDHVRESQQTVDESIVRAATPRPTEFTLP